MSLTREDLELLKKSPQHHCTSRQYYALLNLALSALDAQGERPQPVDLGGRIWAEVRKAFGGDFDEAFQKAADAKSYEMASAHLDEAARILASCIEENVLNPLPEGGS